jgi:hypothetical protein
MDLLHEIIRQNQTKYAPPKWIQMVEACCPEKLVPTNYQSSWG